jgi:hypothetical protein
MIILQTLAERHISECEECRVYADEVVSARNALRVALCLAASDEFDLRVLGSMTPSRDFVDRIIAFFEPGWRQVTVAMASALILAVLI